MKTLMKRITSAFLCVCFCVSMFVIPNLSVETNADDSAIDLGTVFKEWINYPSSSYGSGYAAGWGYVASTGELTTTQNVGFTGYYNPYLMSFTTGTWGIDFMSSDTDPWGFAWGLKTWKNSEGTDSYSFYIYEECGCNHWCIAYIEEWKPAKDGGSHRGPVYHSTIDAADSQYAAHNGGKGSVGFATGKVLAYGTATVKGVRHRITIDATKTKVTLTNSVSNFTLVGTNGSNAVQQGNSIVVDAPIQAGSFGPCSSSNAAAKFYNLSMEAGEDNGAIRADFQPYSDGVPTYAGKAGEHITLENTSWLDPDTKATIKSEEWVVTYMDGEDGPEEIYSGSTPFDGTFDRDGEYKIYLRIISSQGLSARKTKYFTVTGENILTVKYMDEDGNKLCDDFIYRGKAGVPYQTSALSFDGYKLLSVDGEENGYFSDKPFGVTYIYRPLTADDIPVEGGGEDEEPMEVGQVTVKYVDEAGNELLPDLIYKAEIGDSFKTTSLTLPGYSYQGLATDSAAETGRYGFQERTVTYVYKADSTTASNAGTLLVRYIDVNGNTVSSDMVINSDVGSIYTVNRRSVLGYRINRIDGDENVTINNSVQVVNVVYEPATYTASSVVAKYLDTDGNTIRPDDVYNGDDGDPFSVRPAHIKGYKFVKIYEDEEVKDDGTETGTPDTVSEDVTEAGDETLAEPPVAETVPGLVEGVFKPQMLQIITYVYEQVTNIDLDDDGIPDINIDTDDDGTPDVNIDVTGDGIPDINVDTDGDGEPDVNIVDKDEDGIPDKNIDPDEPEVPNVNVVDKDGDGVPDINIDNTDPENPVLPDVNVDTDGDGKPDVNVDKDDDGIPDINIVDKDGDGKPDKDIDPENPPKPDVNIDVTDDGIPDINVDTDGDGKPDVNIVDKDYDGTPDTDIDPENPPKPTVNIVDKDGDGVPDINITNEDPTNPVLPDVNVDVTGNGIPDVNVDTDGDGEPDVNIVDKDGDGKPDGDIDNRDPENPVKPDKDIVDKDEDGVPDIDIIPTPENPVKPDVNVDVDGDGKPDVNVDTDGDGKPDVNIDKNDDGIPDVNIVDKDKDGKPDKGIDNTDPENPVHPDVNVDIDGDGKPDINVDTDGDGEPDVNIDKDGDGKPDINIVDKDGDGKPDKGIDNTDPENPVKPDVNVDTDGDGKPDVNIDNDDDGKPDVNIDNDNDGKPDVNIVDKDGDGKPDKDIDNTDPENPVKPDVNVDTDGDGKPDVNIDNDNDGKPDVNIVDKDGDGKPDKDIDNTDPENPVLPDVNVDTDGDGKPDVNIDNDNDGKPDVNIVDKDGDGKPDKDIDNTDPENPVLPDVNVDTDKDGKPDINVDTDKDGKPDVNISDKDGDGKPDTDIDPENPPKADINIDTDNDGEADVNIDVDNDGKPDINIDSTGDGKADVNVDTNGDGIADINIDSTGDGKADLNLDRDGDGIADANIDTDGDGIADKNIIGDIADTNDAETAAVMWLIVSAAGIFVLVSGRKLRKACR